MKSHCGGPSKGSTTSSLPWVLTKTWFIKQTYKISMGLFVSEEFYFTMKVNTGAMNFHKGTIFQLDIQSIFHQT